MSSNKFNGFWKVLLCLLGMLTISGILCKNVDNSDSEMLKSAGFVTKYIRVKRQIDNFLPNDWSPEERKLETVNFLPDNDRIEGNGDVPVVEQLPVADRIAGQNGLPESERFSDNEGALLAVDRLPESDRVAEKDEDVPLVEQLPESDRIAEQDEDVPVVEQLPESEEQFPQSDRVVEEEGNVDDIDIEQWPVADRVEGQMRRGILPEGEPPVVEQFPFAERVKQEESGEETEHDIVIGDLPIADKVKEYPDGQLPEVESFPEAERVRIEQRDENDYLKQGVDVENLPGVDRVREEHAGDTMYADDAMAAVRIPLETQKTELNPERVVDGKITDDVDIKTVKQLDNWEPDEQPMEADRVQEDELAYDEDLEFAGVKDDELGTITAKLDKIDTDIATLSDKIDDLMAGLEIPSEGTDDEEIVPDEKEEIVEGNVPGEEAPDVSNEY